MDFQTHQDEAKQGTLKLVLLFGAGVLAIIALVSLLLTLLFGYSNNEFDPLPAIAVAAATAVNGTFCTPADLPTQSNTEVQS